MVREDVVEGEPCGLRLGPLVVKGLVGGRDAGVEDGGHRCFLGCPLSWLSDRKSCPLIEVNPYGQDCVAVRAVRKGIPPRTPSSGFCDQKRGAAVAARSIRLVVQPETHSGRRRVFEFNGGGVLRADWEARLAHGLDQPLPLGFVQTRAENHVAFDGEVRKAGEGFGRCRLGLFDAPEGAEGRGAGYKVTFAKGSPVGSGR